MKQSPISLNLCVRVLEVAETYDGYAMSSTKTSMRVSLRGSSASMSLKMTMPDSYLRSCCGVSRTSGAAFSSRDLLGKVGDFGVTGDLGVVGTDEGSFS